MKQRLTLTAFLFILALGMCYAQTTFTGKPRYQIKTTRAGAPLGTFTVELFPNIALHHVRNFDSLVSVHFFDTTAFHRVVPGFVIQGGDPNSRHGAISTWGQGQASQPTVDAEFSAARHIRGRLSAARSNNINSATSQFFVCVATAGNLDGHYSLYGQVTAGMNWVDTIVHAPRYTSPPSYTDTPLQKIEMFVTRIGSNDTVPVAPALLAPANGTVGIDSSYVHLKWDVVNDAIIYHVDVSTDPLFVNDTVLSRDTAITFYNVQHLAGNTIYYWRTRTNNGGHFSSYSPTWSFHTRGETTGIASNSLSDPLHVFPNPSNGKFSFSNIERGNTLEVFDIDGKLIYETVATDNSLTIDLSRKDKGEYFYKVTNEKRQVQKGKLIIQ